MTRTGRLIGSLIIVVGAAMYGVAQNPVALDTGPPPAAAPRTTVKTSGTATAGYEKYRDITYAGSAPINIKLPDSGWGSISAGFTSTGNGVTKPDYIVIRFFTAAKDRSYVDRPDANLIADEKKVFEGKALIKDARTNGREVYASFEIIVSVDDFLTIAKSDKLAVTLGPSGWFIPKAELSKFNDLLGMF